MTNEELQTKIAVHDEKFDAFLRAIQDFKESVKESNERRDADLKDFKNEMRQQNEMRAAENEEIRQAIKEIYTTTDAKITDIKNTIDSTNKHIQNFSIAAFVGIGAMVVTSVIGIAAMVWAVIPKG